VFDVVADTRKEPRYNPRMHHAEQITNGPIGVGTRFHAETASMGRPVDMVIEITDYQPPHCLSSTTHMTSMDLHGTLTFDPDPEGTRMRWAWDLQPDGVLRLLSPLVATMGVNGQRLPASALGNPRGLFTETFGLGTSEVPAIIPLLAAGPFAVEESSMWSARSGGPTPAMPGWDAPEDERH